ncbi:MAG: DUF3050 domain-containing protein [Luteibaculaceae bacterium]
MDLANQINQEINPLKEQIINHPVYKNIKTVDDLKIFMSHHVFAVWDFMSLLKALQNNLTCTKLPWMPVGSANTRYLINEIVCGEESDVDEHGNRISHFELYLKAMEQCGCDLAPIFKFMESISVGNSVQDALKVGAAPKAVQNFVETTFKVIASKKSYLQAAVFTFGREDLIPSMFISLVNDIYQRIPESVSTFKYYLERHIEVDGDHHSNLALEMTSELIGANPEKLEESLLWIKQALERRIQLWDSANAAILKQKEVLA